MLTEESRHTPMEKTQEDKEKEGKEDRCFIASAAEPILVTAVQAQTGSELISDDATSCVAKQCGKTPSSSSPFSPSSSSSLHGGLLSGTGSMESSSRVWRMCGQLDPSLVRCEPGNLSLVRDELRDLSGGHTGVQVPVERFGDGDTPLLTGTNEGNRQTMTPSEDKTEANNNSTPPPPLPSSTTAFLVQSEDVPERKETSRALSPAEGESTRTGIHEGGKGEQLLVKKGRKEEPLSKGRGEGLPHNSGEENVDAELAKMSLLRESWLHEEGVAQQSRERMDQLVAMKQCAGAEAVRQREDYAARLKHAACPLSSRALAGLVEERMSGWQGR